MFIVQAAIVVSASLFPFYLFCHFGGEITDQFQSVGDAAYQIEWYRLPVELQKDLGVVVALGQKRIYMRGYADTCTTHSAFKKVLEEVKQL